MTRTTTAMLFTACLLLALTADSHAGSAPQPQVINRYITRPVPEQYWTSPQWSTQTR